MNTILIRSSKISKREELLISESLRHILWFVSPCFLFVSGLSSSHSLRAVTKRFPVWRTWRSTWGATRARSRTSASTLAARRHSATLVTEPSTSALTWTRSENILKFMFDLLKNHLGGQFLDTHWKVVCSRPDTGSFCLSVKLKLN